MMPEPPDFEQIARQLHTLIAPLPRSVGEQEIAEQLRQVWNARGAADRAQIATACGDASETGYRALTELDRLIRALDSDGFPANRILRQGG
jgi:hypothetical protein